MAVPAQKTSKAKKERVERTKSSKRRIFHLIWLLVNTEEATMFL